MIETEQKEHALDPKQLFYSRKPLACSSPIIVVKDNKQMRWHPGYFSGYHRIEHESYYTLDMDEVQASHVFTEEMKTKKGQLA